MLSLTNWRSNVFILCVVYSLSLLPVWVKYLLLVQSQNHNNKRYKLTTVFQTQKKKKTFFRTLCWIKPCLLMCSGNPHRNRLQGNLQIYNQSWKKCPLLNQMVPQRGSPAESHEQLNAQPCPWRQRSATKAIQLTTELHRVLCCRSFSHYVCRSSSL